MSTIRRPEEIIESKKAFRKQLASLPVGDKLRIVEELAERALLTRRDNSSEIPDEPWQVPANWRWFRMGDVARVVGGGTPKTDHAEYFGGDVPWITPADLSGYKEKTISKGARNITKEGLDNSGARLVPPKTVLFSSRAPIGYVAIAANAVATNQGFRSFILNDDVLPDFAYYYLQRARELAVALASGTTFLEISGKNAARLPIPLPPLDEQRLIVAEIERQLARLDVGVAALRRGRANLKRYRAAVLNAACEGRLVPTEADIAREKNAGGKFETGEMLLSRILSERRDSWCARGKYKEPVSPDKGTLRQLPAGWTWASAQQLTLANRPCAYGVLQPGPDVSDGVPFVRVGDINNGKVDVSELKRISPIIAAQYPRTRLFGGELAISLVGAIGRTAIIPKSLAGGNTARAVGILPLTPKTDARWIELWFRNPTKIAEMDSKSHEVARKTLNLEDVRIATVALPPLAEQVRIVSEVERRLSVIDELEAMVAANVDRSARLRQSILQKAFAGELVASAGDIPAKMQRLSHT